MTTPGRIDKQFVSAIGMLDVRDFKKYLFRPNENQADLALLLMQLGRVKSFKPSIEQGSQWVFYNYSMPQVMELISTAGATITNNGTAAVTVQMASAVLSGFIRKNYQVRLGTKTAWIYSVTRNAGVATMVIKSVDGTNITVPTNATIPVVGNAFGEGSLGQTPIRQDFGRKENLIQIFKENDVVTDVVNAAKIEVPEGETYAYISHLLMYERHFAEISAAVIASQITPAGFNSAAPSLVDDENQTVQTTRGIDQYVESFGIKSPAQTAGTYTINDIYALEDAWKAARLSPQKMYGFTGIVGRRPLANYAKNLTGSNGISAARIDVNGRTVDLGIDMITFPGGSSIDLIPLSIMNDPDTIGAIPDIANSIYFIPEGNAPTDKGAVAPYLGLRYMEQPAVKNMNSNTQWEPVEAAANLKVMETHSGQMSPYGAVGSRAEHRVDLYSAIGVDGVVPEHWSKVRMS